MSNIAAACLLNTYSLSWDSSSKIKARGAVGVHRSTSYVHTENLPNPSPPCGPRTDVPSSAHVEKSSTIDFATPFHHSDLPPANPPTNWHVLHVSCPSFVLLKRLPRQPEPDVRVFFVFSSRDVAFFRHLTVRTLASRRSAQKKLWQKGPLPSVLKLLLQFGEIDPVKCVPRTASSFLVCSSISTCLTSSLGWPIPDRCVAAYKPSRVVKFHIALCS